MGQITRRGTTPYEWAKEWVNYAKWGGGAEARNWILKRWSEKKKNEVKRRKQCSPKMQRWRKKGIKAGARS